MQLVIAGFLGQMHRIKFILLGLRILAPAIADNQQHRCTQRSHAVVVRFTFTSSNQKCYSTD